MYVNGVAVYQDTSRQRRLKLKVKWY